MPETVSKLAAFVFAHGEMADEILFRDVEEDGEIPGLLPEEREAMERATPLLRETWIAILTACRQAMWEVAAGHPSAETLRTTRTRPNKMWENKEVKMPLVAGGRAECGFCLAHWGATEYQLHAWVWTQVRHRASAEAAINGLTPAPWRGDAGSFILSLGTPKEGERLVDIGARAAAALWTMARPIAEAIAAGQAS